MNNPQRLLTVVLLMLLGIAGARQNPPTLYASCMTNDLIYSTLLGDSLPEEASAVAVDANGTAFVSGTTESVTFPSARAPRHGIDFVSAALSADGSALDSVLWVSPMAFNDVDEGTAVVVDPMGNRYVAGLTNSADFCAYLGSNIPGYDTTFNGNTDGFLIKINASDSVEYCTYLGGDQLDIVRDIAVSDTGEVYVTGGTWSDETSAIPFPKTTAVSHAGQRDVFVVKLDADGALVYSTLYGGTLQEEGLDIAVNQQGETFVTGWSRSDNLPTTTMSYDELANGGFDGFVFKLSADGTQFDYATYLGGAGEDRAFALALDADDKVTVVGRTNSADFPTTPNAFQTAIGGNYDLFLAEISADGASLNYSTLVGGAAEDRAQDVVLANGDLFVTGVTFSADFPTTADAADNSLGGTQDAFLLRFHNDQLVYSTYYGGSEEDVGNGLFATGDALYWAGGTRSADFCTTPNAYDTTHNGDYDIFLTKLDLPEKRIYLPVVIR